MTLDGAAAHASMLQNPAEHGVEPEAAAVLAAVGLQEGDGHAGWPPQVVSTGVPHVVAPLRDVAALERAGAHPSRLEDVLVELGATCVYIAAVDARAGTARARSFFLGDTGTLEDPATGSAVGPLVAYLAQRAGIRELTVSQGAEIGRPSTLHGVVEGDLVRVERGRRGRGRGPFALAPRAGRPSKAPKSASADAGTCRSQ